MFKGGKLLDVFGAGTHTLTSLNIPFLADVIGLAFGGDTPFTAEVFYVNKALSQDAKWGLMPFNIVEPNFKVPIPITCRGSYSVKIVDSRKFLTEIVGVSSLYNQLELQKLFRGIITESTKNAIWKLSDDLGLGPLELEYMVKELSNSIQPAVKLAMSKYGLEISFFSVEGISVIDEDERVRKIVEDYHRIMSEDMEEKLRLKRRAEQLNVYKVERTFDTSNTASIPRPCTKCQTPLQTKDLFCGTCGMAQNINASKPDTATEKKVSCDKCATDFSPKYKFCPNCGDGYNPCPNCNTDLGNNTTICNACEFVLPKVCECGNQLPPESKYCSNCGKSVSE
jgi:membrane protease subunit (stomatin/prohibitin family)